MNANLKYSSMLLFKVKIKTKIIDHFKYEIFTSHKQDNSWTQRTNQSIITHLKAQQISGLPWWLSKESACNAGDPGSILGWEDLLEKGIGYPLQYSQASLVAQLVKNLPAMWETWVRSLHWEDPLEKGTATTPVSWPGEFHGLYSPWGRKEMDTTERFSLHFQQIFIEGL